MKTPRHLAAIVLLLLASSTAALAASFGVPATIGGAADGWFVLIGKDSVDEAQSDFFGDITRELRLFIEVTDINLDLCIFDPGTFHPALGPSQLDLEFVAGASRSTMHYELFDPLGMSVKRDDTSFGPDCPGGDPTCAGGAATDAQPWCFYQSALDGPVAPGVYQLLVRMIDGPGLDQHANIFGVRTTPDYNAFSYYATVGHSTPTGASLPNNVVRMYPWIVSGSAGVAPAFGDACAVDIATFDFDAPVPGATPPAGELITRLLWSEPFVTSADGVVRIHEMYNLAGLNAGDDHGIHTLEFRDLSAAQGVLENNLVPPLPAPLDFNAFSFQVYDTGGLNPALFYPIAPPDPLANSYRPRRLYLASNSGNAPVKEYVTHAITNVPVGRRYTVGTPAILMIELRIENPTAYDLRNIAGSVLIPAIPELGPPTAAIAFGGQGRMAAVTGRQIDYSFNRLRAGQTAGVRYNVNLTPSIPGYLFITGDGSDFAGGANPTNAMWDTATGPGVTIATGELARPCEIQVESIAAPCTADATAAAPARACLNETITLDATSPISLSCPGNTLEYRWSGPGITTPVFDLSPILPVNLTTSGINTFTLEIRCQGMTTCANSHMVDVTVSSAPKPTADAGGDRVFGLCDLPAPVGAPGDPVLYSYAWTSTLPIATLIDDPTVPEPNFILATVGMYDLTLTVTALADPLCVDAQTILVTVNDGTPVGIVGNTLRAVGRLGDVELTWPLGVIQPDRYNLHRGADKLEIDKSALPGSYLAAILNPLLPITTGTYTDVAATPSPLFVYEVYGRDCAGLSDIR